MSLELMYDDIRDLKVDADAVVVAVGPEPGSLRGVAAGLYEQAGPQLCRDRQAIGRMEVGQAAITMAYDLDVIYVIHTVSPVWQDGSQGEEEQLLQCYRNSLELARTHNCRSVAFSLLGAEDYGVPIETCRRIASQAFEEFLAEYEMEIFLVERPE